MSVSSVVKWPKQAGVDLHFSSLSMCGAVCPLFHTPSQYGVLSHTGTSAF
jgi:hypothetical protein